MKMVDKIQILTRALDIERKKLPVNTEPNFQRVKATYKKLYALLAKDPSK